MKQLRAVPGDHEQRDWDNTDETTIDQRGLKCPSLALRNPQSPIARLQALVVECTDPLAEIDNSNLMGETRNALEHFIECARIECAREVVKMLQFG
jgi:hypothetical protein